MSLPIQPILLLADSQLLFWHDDGGELFLARVRAMLEGESPKCAYVGAANGDQLEFYDLFRGAMEGVGLRDCRMIPSEPAEDDLAFFDEAELILLAGGDVRRGWQVFQDNGLSQKVIERYYTGALLVGVSAGAVQLGLFGPPPDGGDPEDLLETFKLVPLLVDVHDEPGWERLGENVTHAGGHVRGLGIPSGGGAFVQPDVTVEPIRRPLTELTLSADGVEQSLIFPPGPEDEDGGGS